MSPFPDLDKDILHFIIHHVIMPPQLPQAAKEPDIRTENFQLLEFLARVAGHYASSSSYSVASMKAKKLLEKTARIHDPAADLSKRLIDTISEMEEGDFFALHVVMQNAGIIFHRQDGFLQTEVFEASPTPEAVINCKGRLKCRFPGPVRAIPWKTAKDLAFLKELGSFLDHMDTRQFTTETLSTSRKGGSDLSEQRDVADPRYIIELFTGIMRGIGKEVTPRYIWKSLRDEVNYKSALNPWRRSGLWLVTRVALQTALGYNEYKYFMLEVVRAILDEANKLQIDSYLISCTSRKLARRASKIEESEILQSLLERTLNTAEKAHDIISSRWKVDISKSERNVRWDPLLGAPSNITANSSFRLNNASFWLEKRLKAYRNPTGTSRLIKDPTEELRYRYTEYLPSISVKETEFETAMRLVDFENRIREKFKEHCSSAVETNTTKSLKLISQTIQEYHAKAMKIYDDHNILDVSRMILTIMEMWVQLDKIVCERVPLLLQYSPELRSELLEPALFIQKEDMERLVKVESHLRARRSQGNQSIFARNISAGSFGVQYYNQSEALQDLKSSILERARVDKEQKREELNQKNSQYKDLMATSERLSCEYRYNNKGKSYHSKWCQKCSLKTQAKSIKITPNEWPLPANENEAKVVVFELRPPEEFTIWRDITYYIMLEVCAVDPNESSPEKFYDFSNWDILASSMLKSSSSSRVIWASKDKPTYSKSHYRVVTIPNSEKNVLVGHAGHYRPLDTKTSEWIDSRHKSCSIVPLCESKLAGTLYEGLSYAVNSTAHTHNTVIAEQHKCPSSMTLHEYEAFTSLRSGSYIQWHNVLTELRKDDLKFKDESVYTLILHTVCNVGVTTENLDWRRASHLTLSEEEFSRELLETLSQALRVLEDNWEQANTLKLLILLARRLITGGHLSVRSDALKFLQTARRLCNPWIKRVQSKLMVASEPNVVENLRYWLLRISGIQCSTFDVDEELLPSIFATPEDSAQYIICLINIYDNCLGVLAKLPNDIRFLLETIRRFAITAEQYIHRNIHCDSGILSNVLQSVLGTWRQAGVWQQLKEPAGRWWKLNSDGGEGFEATVVHINVLEGKLLTNGKPNGRLPAEYFTHESYTKLLGTRILDVIPSQMPNMSYQTKNQFYGLVLHFDLEAGDLIIRKQDGEDHEFVPAQRFLGDVPTPLVQCGSQWLNLKQEKVIFYQSDSWWNKEASAKDWTLRRKGCLWGMDRGSDKLLDLNGDIHSAVYKHLGSIEAKEYLSVTTDKGGRLNIDLPRYKLKFFVNESNFVECESIKGWIIDQHQNLGTFIGLRNFLKLKSSNEYLDKECVIVPFGSIEATSSKDGNQYVVRIIAVGDERTYAIYNIDKFLNQVRDNGTLKARYTRIYLHALTSGIMEDPLTGRTGCHEALELLKDAASYSFQQLQDEEANILKQIAALTPSRNFYPPHKRRMQTIEWNKIIPIWSQHDDFYVAVQDIFHDWNRRQFLIDGSKSYDISLGANDLLERGRNIGSIFATGDPRASHRYSATLLHNLRHEVTERSREACIHDISKASFEWLQKQDLDSGFYSSLMGKSILKGFQPSFALEYSSIWADTTPSDLWCTLYELCRQATKKKQFGLLFIFSFLVYNNPSDHKFLKSLLAVATNNAFNDLEMPRISSFKLNKGTQPKIKEIENIIDGSQEPFTDSEYSRLSRNPSEPEVEWYKRRHSAYENAVEQEVKEATEEIYAQWPRESFTLPYYKKYRLLNLESVADKIRPIFQNCFENLKFSEHLLQAIARLQPLKSNLVPLVLANCATKAILQQPEFLPSQARQRAPNLEQLLEERENPSDLDIEVKKPYNLIVDKAEMDDKMELESLPSLAQSLRNLNHKFANQYADDLLESIEALRSSEQNRNLTEIPVSLSFLQENRKVTIANIRKLMLQLSYILSPKRKIELLQSLCGLWPNITRLHLLRRLRLAERSKLSRGWMKVLITLGEAITWSQRANRLVDLEQKRHVQEFQREAENTGRQNWKAEEYIDWLLLELESDMLIRPVQADIGFSMMDHGNAVMQLNMGEGKSAVIVPAVAATLANTKQLVRSIVLKPLSTQMFQILVQRLSGLCDRRIYFLPFWRNIKIDKGGVEKIRKLYEDCMRSGAIILALPEHILSFKLMGIEKLMQKDQEVSEPLIACQQWLSRNSRDILDESDEILHIRYQLVYTVGKQLTLEGGSERWVLIQELLELVQEKAIEFSERYPLDIEVGPAKGVRYRHIRIINTTIGERMLEEVALAICSNGSKVPSISSKLTFLDDAQRNLVLRYISSRDISLEEQNALFEGCDSLKTPLLVLRGLIADGVLLFLFRDKRYRVDYGLDRKRSGQLAVPYRAKDQPALRAEFGHPEVVLVLTCLTYYYGGLDNDHLQNCFDLLSKTDNPELTYDHWIGRHSSVPPQLSKLSGINFLDQEHVTKEVFPFLKHNKAIIDFFLAEYIFPREAKAFSHKLSTNAWDLVEQKSLNITGFSGTNDNKYLLPIGIKQSNLPQQTHTNSLVLKNILRSENTVVKIHKDNMRLEANDYIAQIAELTPKVRVLLDVGAQILELDNQEVAKTWLQIDQSEEIQGAVFFGDDDKLLIMNRDGRIESFMSSKLSQQLESVVVFLDEAHTRGVDLRLPSGTRAAVTLGPNLVKDKLVQGCMRMRKLGNGHSLEFLASPDIYVQIQQSAKKQSHEPINSYDVLLWSMLESCRQIQHGFSIWANQGLHYLTRKSGWERFRQSGCIDQLKETAEEIEARPLLDMYGIGGQSDWFQKRPQTSDEQDTILGRLEQFGISTSNKVSVQEEQEREVDQELEVEMNIERPNPAKPAKHSLHPDIEFVARLGVLREGSNAFALAYRQYSKTSARLLLEYDAWASNLYASADFTTTVVLKPSDNMDDYLRPVRWILRTKDSSNLILLSPFEANQLFPIVRNSKACSLHCYAPKVSKAMPTFEFLNFCPTPESSQTPQYENLDLSTRIALNTFAGQLFYHDKRYYVVLCKYLGIYYNKMDKSLKRDVDGWISELTRQKLNLNDGEGPTSKFSRSPLRFLAEIVKMRRKGQGFSLTHFGSILAVKELKDSDF